MLVTYELNARKKFNIFVFAPCSSASCLLPSASVSKPDPAVVTIFCSFPLSLDNISMAQQSWQFSPVLPAGAHQNLPPLFKTLCCLGPKIPTTSNALTSLAPPSASSLEHLSVLRSCSNIQCCVAVQPSILSLYCLLRSRLETFLYLLTACQSW